MDNSSESGVTGCRISDATRRRENVRVMVTVRQREREREGEIGVEEKQGQGIARVNALSRCWSCLITSYQLKGKWREKEGAREGGKEEERSEIGLW